MSGPLDEPRILGVGHLIFVDPEGFEQLRGKVHPKRLPKVPKEQACQCPKPFSASLHPSLSPGLGTAFCIRCHCSAAHYARIYIRAACRKQSDFAVPEPAGSAPVGPRRPQARPQADPGQDLLGHLAHNCPLRIADDRNLLAEFSEPPYLYSI
jgi:hypothetical protein